MSITQVQGRHNNQSQTLDSEATIEGFDQCVVSRFSRPGEVEHDTALQRPQVQVAPHKLSALVDLDRCRQSNRLSPDPFSTSTTSAPQKEQRGCSAGEKRENVSTIVKTPSLRPMAT
jgi:hypothetical protein